MAADLFGAHVAGTSLVHRARPGVKLALLAVTTGVVLGVRTPSVQVAGAVAVVAAAAVARLPARALARQVRPALFFAVTAGGLTAWTSGPVAGATVAASLVVAVAAAAVVTLTTSAQALLDALLVALRPVRRFGVDPERVALTLALAVSSVPVVARLATEVRQARMARGAERSLRAFAVPFMIRTVRHADRLGEALRARGADD